MRIGSLGAAKAETVLRSIISSATSTRRCSPLVWQFIVLMVVLGLVLDRGGGFADCRRRFWTSCPARTGSCVSKLLGMV